MTDEIADEISSYCRLKAREHDADAYLAALFAPERERRDLWALQAFAAEIARVPQLVSEPMLGEIRLQWWREALDRLFDGARDPHPVTTALAQTLSRRRLDRTTFEQIIDAHARELGEVPVGDSVALDRYIQGTRVGPLLLQASVLAPELAGHEALNAALDATGQALGLAAMLTDHRRRAMLAPALLAERPRFLQRAQARLITAKSALRELGATRLLPITLPLSLIPSKLRRLECADGPVAEAPLFLRQLRYLRAVIRGQI